MDSACCVTVPVSLNCLAKQADTYTCSALFVGKDSKNIIFCCCVALKIDFLVNPFLSGTLQTINQNLAKKACFLLATQVWAVGMMEKRDGCFFFLEVLLMSKLGQL